ncbi:hypothetical protein C8Q74DRAFT_1286042 [Fomes fomentarius]|nr:hypothetical protein C8Q74DRAFT_1286042 [Fomes fomentarius]
MIRTRRSMPSHFSMAVYFRVFSFSRLCLAHEKARCNSSLERPALMQQCQLFDQISPRLVQPESISVAPAKPNCPHSATALPLPAIIKAVLSRAPLTILTQIQDTTRIPRGPYPHRATRSVIHRTPDSGSSNLDT